MTFWAEFLEKYSLWDMENGKVKEEMAAMTPTLGFLNILEVVRITTGALIRILRDNNSHTNLIL